MPITLDCPKCHSKLHLPEDAAGKKAKCPKCEAIMTVPGAGITSRPAAVTEVEDDDRDYDKPRAQPKPPRPAIGVGVFSAFITLLAFASLGGAAWMGMDGSHMVTQVCIYTAIGLTLLGLLSSLYTRGALRVLDFLFGLGAVAANVLCMLVFTGTHWRDAFHDAGIGVVQNRMAAKAFFNAGDTAYLVGDEHGDKHDTFGFKDRQEMEDIMHLGIFDGNKKMQDTSANRTFLLKKCFADGKAFTLPVNTKVEVVDYDTNIQVKVLDGPHEGKVLWIFAQSSVRKQPQKPRQ